MTKRDNEHEGEYLTPGKAASLAFVSYKTLGRLADEGSIASFTLPSGHRRYLADDIQRLRDGTLEVTKVYPRSPAAEAAAAS